MPRNKHVSKHSIHQKPIFYQVQAIKDMKIDRNGKKHYLIKWKGYSESDNTWEPLQNLGKVMHWIKQFQNSRKVQTSQSKKEQKKKPVEKPIQEKKQLKQTEQDAYEQFFTHQQKQEEDLGSFKRQLSDCSIFNNLLQMSQNEQALNKCNDSIQKKYIPLLDQLESSFDRMIQQVNQSQFETPLKPTKDTSLITQISIINSFSKRQKLNELQQDSRFKRTKQELHPNEAPTKGRKCRKIQQQFETNKEIFKIQESQRSFQRQLQDIIKRSRGRPRKQFK